MTKEAEPDEDLVYSEATPVIVEWRQVRGEFLGAKDRLSKATPRALRGWLSDIGVKTMFIEPGSPWENGYIESFNGKFRDELPNREVFITLTEAQILIEWWRKEYNQVRPHSSLGYRPPAPQTILPTMLNYEVIPGTITGGRSLAIIMTTQR